MADLGEGNGPYGGLDYLDAVGVDPPVGTFTSEDTPPPEVSYVGVG